MSATPMVRIPCSIMPLTPDDKVRAGFFLGLANDEREQLCAVIYIPDYGMMLYMCHPSRVVLKEA